MGAIQRLMARGRASCGRVLPVLAMVLIALVTYDLWFLGLLEASTVSFLWGGVLASLTGLLFTQYSEWLSKRRRLDRLLKCVLVEVRSNRRTLAALVESAQVGQLAPTRVMIPPLRHHMLGELVALSADLPPGLQNIWNLAFNLHDSVQTVNDWLRLRNSAPASPVRDADEPWREYEDVTVSQMQSTAESSLANFDNMVSAVLKVPAGSPEDLLR